MHCNGLNSILIAIALYNCVPLEQTTHNHGVHTNKNETPILVPAPQNNIVNGNRIESENEIPSTQLQPSNDTKTLNNAKATSIEIREDGTIDAKTNFAGAIIPHTTDAFWFYKYFFICLNRKCEEHSKYINKDLNIEHQKKDALPIIINNFNIDAASEFAIEQINLTDRKELKNAQKHVKVLLEMIVVLEHLFIQTRNEYKKLNEYSVKKIKNYEENILNTGNEKQLTIEEIEQLNNAISAARLNAAATKGTFCKRLFSIFTRMSEIQSFLHSELLSINVLKCPRRRIYLPRELYVKYEPALQFILNQDGYEKFKNRVTAGSSSHADNSKQATFNVETPITSEPFDNDVELKDDLQNYSWYNFWWDLDEEEIKYNRMIRKARRKIRKFLRIADTIIIYRYNVSKAFKYAVEKIESENTTEKESMDIIGKIVTILNWAFRLNYCRSKGEIKSLKDMKQYHCNMVSIFVFLKNKIKPFIKAQSNKPSLINDIISCCVYHSYLKADDEAALRFLKQHPEYKAFIEESSENNTIVMPGIDDLTEDSHPSDINVSTTSTEITEPSEAPRKEEVEKPKLKIPVVTDSSKANTSPGKQDPTNEDEIINESSLKSKIFAHKGKILIGAFVVILAIAVALKISCKDGAVSEAAI
ncbi:hypothetical protein ENBRE01_2317 [Enteropsectra breve]|nr:hypothetical protein ENBRE01_2317 [Enteropsectra breve]